MKIAIGGMVAALLVASVYWLADRQASGSIEKQNKHTGTMILLGCYAYSIDEEGTWPENFDLLFPGYLESPNQMQDFRYVDPHTREELDWVYLRPTVPLPAPETVILKAPQPFRGETLELRLQAIGEAMGSTLTIPQPPDFLSSEPSEPSEPSAAPTPPERPSGPEPEE